MTMPKLPTFKEFKGAELSAVMFVLLLYFVYKEFTDTECQDLRTQVAVLTEEKRELIEDKTNLVNALLIKNGVIDAFVQTTDSTIRAKLEEPINKTQK